MTDKELRDILFELVKKGNCFTKEIRDLLIKYKNFGGQRDTAKQMLLKMKTENTSNETIQDGVDDILDIVTGYCVADMRVWI